jgi:hypothetical protein
LPYQAFVFRFGILQSQYNPHAAAMLKQMYTHRNPKSLHLLAKSMLTLFKYSVVEPTGQYWQTPVAEGSTT